MFRGTRSQTQHNSRHAEWQRNIRVLSVTRGITLAGAEAGYIGLLALAWQLTGSASQASLVLIASVLGGFVGGPIGGWIGDHADRRKVIIIAEFVVGSAYLSLTFANSITHVAIALFIGAFGGTTAGAAVDASVANLVPSTELMRANATLGMGQTIGHMVGPLLGGLIVATLGAHAVFLIDGLTSLLAGVLIFLVRGELNAPRTTVHQRDRDVLAGLRFIGHEPVIRWYVLGWVSLAACFAFVTGAELPIAVEHGYDEIGIAIIVTSWCAGSLLGGWYVKVTAGRERSTAHALVVNSLVCGVVFAAAGLTPWFSMLVACMALGGWSMAIANAQGQALLQTRTADHVRARVLATARAMSSALFGLCLPLAAWLVDRTSPGMVYEIAGLTALVGAACYLVLGRKIRREHHDHAVQLMVPRHALESDLVAGA